MEPISLADWVKRLLNRWSEIHLGQVLDAAFSVAGTLLVYLLLRRLVARAIEAAVMPIARRVESGHPGRGAGRAVTLRGLLTSIANYLLLFVAGVMALSSIGLNITALLTGAGVAGLAVGFGAQKLVRDVITGFFILLEDQFSVGDTITVAGVTGVVEEMGMRVTRLRDEVGKQITVANGDITTVTNHSRGPTLVSVDVSVAAATDLETLAACVARIADALPPGAGLLTEAPVIRGVTAFDAVRVTVRVSARAVPGRQQDAELALRQALREELLRSGVTPA